MKIEIFNNSVEKFIFSLEKNTRAKAVHTLDLLERFGNQLGMPHSKKVSKNIFELRIQGRQSIRIFYAFHNNRVILLHSFIKKTVKIPQKEINLARKRLADIEQQ